MWGCSNPPRGCAGKKGCGVGDGMSRGPPPLVRGKLDVYDEDSGVGPPPRVRENHLPVEEPTLAAGSPPHVRGILPLSRHVVLIFRLTPACAGNTASQARMESREWAHPRVCGEYISVAVSLVTGVGPPPRVRGIPLHRCRDRRSTGDHPRVCGEYYCSRRRRSDAHGTTPACAGNT